MARHTRLRRLDLSVQVARWLMFAITALALVYLLSIVLWAAIGTKTIDEFVVITIALAAGGVRAMFLFLKWFKRLWMLGLNLLPALLAFVAAYVSLIATGSGTTVTPFLFWAGLSALVLSSILYVLDAKELQPSVWMWKERTWWDRKLDIETDPREIVSRSLANSIEGLAASATLKHRKGSTLQADADQAAAALIRSLVPQIPSTQKSKGRTRWIWLSSAGVFVAGVFAGSRLPLFRSIGVHKHRL